MPKLRSLFFPVLLVVATVAQAQEPPQILRDLETLASKEFAGRETGTAGNEKARAYILQRFEEIGLEGVGTQEFTFESEDGDELMGYNVLGSMEGASETTIVISAHYDHLGIHEGEIFYGSDDNASGVAAMMHVAEQLASEPIGHNLLFAAFDAEEKGLQGAVAFVADSLGVSENVIMNINFDMVSKSDVNELFAVGTRYAPRFKPVLQEIDDRHDGVILKFGHDGADPKEQDWTYSSDHGPFHRTGVPFLYFGVADHPEYHQPTDVFETTPKEFYVDVAGFLVDVVKTIDGLDNTTIIGSSSEDGK